MTAPFPNTAGDGRGPAFAASLLGSSQSLRFGSAFSTPKPKSCALALGSLRGPMLLAYRSGPVGIAAMHPAMFGRIDRFDVFRAAARRPVARVMDVLPRGPVKRLVNEAMHPACPAANFDEAVALCVLRAGPKPAISIDNQTTI